MLEPAPTVLTMHDDVVGDGAEAPANSTVKVHYLGVDYETGEEFDSSWSRGESIEFPLNRLIKGWQEGIPGMKVGGRRRLEIPGDLAYGASGRPPIQPNETLVFTIDLVPFINPAPATSLQTTARMPSTLLAAMEDPTDLNILEFLKKNLRANIKAFLATLAPTPAPGRKLAPSCRAEPTTSFLEGN